MKTRWWQYAIVGFLMMIVVCLSILGVHVYRRYYQPMMLGDDNTGIISLDKSMSATAFAHALKSRHMIQSERLFLALIQTEKLSHRLKAGIYQIKPGETCSQFLLRVVAGDVMVESFQIIEGTTLHQVSEHLAHAPYLIYNEADWLALTPKQALSAEGLLLADTYRYNAGSNSKELLTVAHAHLQKYLDASWHDRALGLPYKTPYELLIAASIIEKETAVSTEKRLISGVILNRLNQHMPLQMDPTVIYALGTSYHGKLTHEDMHIDSPFNTYRYRGLPPTPIAMVGKDAIDAAAHPEKTDYLYFVARGDGTHQFSVTYDQQKEAIARYMTNQ